MSDKLTHYDGCWIHRSHHLCAVTEIETLRAKVAELEAEKETIINNAIEVLFGSCDKHIEEARPKTFAEFQAMLQPSCHLCAIAQLAALQTAIDATGEVHPSWNTSKDFQDGWRECIAHIREDTDRPATYFSRMRAELSELRERVEGLVDEWQQDGPIDAYDHSSRARDECAEELRALITQTTPTVNSAEAVNGGEDSGYGKRFAAQRLAKEIIEERGENFAALLQSALDDAL